MLIAGAIICPGSRTVCNLLRSVGLQAERCFPKYHRLLSQDKWSAKRLSGSAALVVGCCFRHPGEALVFGFDDTIERRWGAKIKKRGIYRDPVRSSKSHFVKCSIALAVFDAANLACPGWKLAYFGASCVNRPMPVGAVL
ncbi:MAG: transposase [Lewinellaceae bacterium]|nr:transposase [Lewinellaceae bacterium]